MNATFSAGRVAGIHVGVHWSILVVLLLEDTGTRDAPAEPSVLHDPESGVRVLPGRLTALAGASPADTATVIDRLGRYTPSTATWGGFRWTRSR